MNTCYERGKKRGIMVKSSQRHLWAKHGYKSDVWENGGKKDPNNYKAIEFFLTIMPWNML